MSVPDDDADGDDAPGDMSDGHEGTGQRAVQPNPGSRCAGIRLASGDLVIYDGESGDAWIQSTVAVEIAAVL